MKRVIAFAALCLLTLSVSALAQVASVPPLMNFQGRLANPDGTPLADGTYALTFSLWDDAAAGNQLWSQTFDSLTVHNGVFSALLLVDTPNLFDGNLWLEIQIGMDTPLAPRQQMVSVAYAQKANLALNVADASITDSKIVSVDYSKILNAPASNFTLPYAGTLNSYTAGISVTNQGNALVGYTNDANYATVYGKNLASGNFGWFGAVTYGVYGESASTSNGYGVFGKNSYTGNTGGIGGPAAGAYGTGSTYGVEGDITDPSIPIYTPIAGVYGQHSTTYNNGFQIIHSKYTDGYLAGAYGVYGENPSAGTSGYIGGTSYGVYGKGTYGVVGYSNGNNEGVLGGTNYGVYGGSVTANSYGGYFTASNGGTALYVAGTASVSKIVIRGGADLAENFDVKDSTGAIKPGMVVEIDPQHEGALRLATGIYNRRVAGVISGAHRLDAGITLTDPSEKSENAQPVAMSGRVWVYADATEHAIEPGDLLTTAARPGYAMAVTDANRAQGAILGKAMGHLAKGTTGLVLTLVNLQ